MSINDDRTPLEAIINEDGSGVLRAAGKEHRVAGKDIAEASEKVIELAAAEARRLGHPVKVITRGAAGEYRLLVHGDGAVTEDQPLEVSDPKNSQENIVDASTAASEPAPAKKPQRESFLKQARAELPAQQGWRALLGRCGIKIAPSAAEVRERNNTFAVSQHWPGPRTIAIVNGKGGANKTPTTILLSAIFARYGGAGVLAWDSNHTRGTLGWRTEQGSHDATVLDLLPNADKLLGTSAQSADLAHFVHHQTKDRFDVLRSQPMLLSSEQRLSIESVDAVWAVASKYYRLVFIDTGNDESDETWRRIVDHADQLVVAATNRDDSAETGALLLEALTARGGKYEQLAKESVVIVSQADPKGGVNELNAMREGFQALAREVAVIPYDVAMVAGWLHLDALKPSTQSAWLAAAAAVARGL